MTVNTPAPDLTQLIRQVRGEYLARRGPSYDINDGACGIFAEEVIRRFQDAHPQEKPPQIVWLADIYSMPNYKELINHAVILYRGYYFDSDVPEGMPGVCPRFLPTWRKAADLDLRRPAPKAG